MILADNMHTLCYINLKMTNIFIAQEEAASKHIV